LVEIQAGAYADTLHALGLFIDQTRTAWTELTAQGDRWSITWERPLQSRFDPFDLEALRRVARLHRGLGVPQPRSPVCRKLRAVGRLLDQIRARSFVITVVPDGLQVVARTIEGEEAQVYRAPEIARLVRSQQRRRAAKRERDRN
jgi:hypothetical protein